MNVEKSELQVRHFYNNNNNKMFFFR